MKRSIFIGTLVILLLSACSAAATDQPTTDEGDATVVTVYRSPT